MCSIPRPLAVAFARRAEAGQWVACPASRPADGTYAGLFHFHCSAPCWAVPGEATSRADIDRETREAGGRAGVWALRAPYHKVHCPAATM